MACNPINQMYQYLRKLIATPIFIFQMGKVGSASLLLTLSANHDGFVVHAHGYDMFSMKQKVYLWWRKRFKLPIYVICPVREPLSRNISAFFQNFKRDTGFECTDKEWSADELLELFLKNFPHNECLDWFDSNLRTTFGLDVFSEPFPTEQKWKIYKHESVHILIYRSDLDRSAQLDLISRFIGRKISGWIYDNISANKSYGEIYKRFIGSARLPDIYISKMCNSKFCRKFWSGEEIKIIEDRFKGYQSAASANETVPLVSVVVSAYNSERFIRGCLEDLEAQTIADRLEIIVVDSGSQQNERAIVKEFQQRYNNIVYIRTEARESVYAAWNRGIQAAHGKYLTNANTDDRHKKDAFERMVAVLETRPEIALVYANVYVTETENETFQKHARVGAFHWPDFDPLQLIYRCFIGPQPMWRKYMHTKHGYFDESFSSSGDWEFWLRLAETETFLHLDEFLGLYLNSPASVAHRNLDLVRREDLRVHQRYSHRAGHLKAAWQESVVDEDRLIWFTDLQVGQRLRVKGTPGAGETFLAFEIIRERLAYPTFVQGLVQRVDHAPNTLCLLNREFILPGGMAGNGAQDRNSDLKTLKPADRVTLLGKYSEPKGFTPKRIRINETRTFGMEELQGEISKIDRGENIFEVNGFRVLVTARTSRGSLMRYSMRRRFWISGVLQWISLLHPLCQRGLDAFIGRRSRREAGMRSAI